MRSVVILAAVAMLVDVAIMSDAATVAKDRVKRDENCLPEYARIDGHSACLPKSSNVVESGVSEDDKQVIVDLHNQFRNDVTPPATDMLKLSWDERVAKIAQSWADNCVYKHDGNPQRSVVGRLAVGQNLGLGHQDWTSVITGWHDEVKDFTYGTPTTKTVGHYTQVVWAKSRVVGCGYAKCSNLANSGRFWVCNYGPSGNSQKSLYKPYTSGTAASACPNHKEGNLCACSPVCENSATWDLATCTCECKKPAFHKGSNCKLDCAAAATAGCPYPKSYCAIYSNVPADCPVLCDVCPLRGQ